MPEAYGPLLHLSKSWGECSRENVANFLGSFDKFSAALGEISLQTQADRLLLERPSDELKAAIVLQHGRGVLLGPVLLECEALVADWVGSIEGLMIETTDER